jgi:hypothetical protein
MDREVWGPWIPPMGFLSLMAIIFIPILMRSTLRRRRRARMLAAFAQRHNLFFRPGPDPRGQTELPSFEGNIIWPALDALNKIEGSFKLNGHHFEARLGDCISTLGKDIAGSDALSDAMNDPKDMRSYAAVRLPTTVVPDVVITPRLGLPRVIEALGLEEVRLELDEFNRRFLVASNNPRFAYDILQPRTMELFGDTLPVRIVIGRGWCMAMSLRGIWDAEQLEAALTLVGCFVGLWPDFVMRDLESRAPRQHATWPAPPSGSARLRS